MNRTLLALAVVVSTSLATLLSLAPISRLLSKVGATADGFSVWHTAQEIFWRQTLPCLAVGLALATLGARLAGSRPLLALLLLIAAPIAVMATNLAQLVLL